MANIKERRSQNIDGNFFVDSSCIDCGTCYWMSDIYQRDSGQSAVIAKPKNDEESIRAYQALLSCPTNSIGVEDRLDIFKNLSDSFPHNIADDVYHNGFHSKSSFGAASYSIKRENGDSWMIDSPRFNTKLLKKYESWGGISEYFLTHKDDVADISLFHEKLGGRRSIHLDDKNQKSDDFERFFEGEDEIRHNDDLLIIPVPGHTKGHVVFLYKEKFLFTGDHLAFMRKDQHLYAFRTACWYDWDIQIKSMERLLNYSFEYVLPGHGAPFSGTKEEMKKQLETCIKWMKDNA